MLVELVQEQGSRGGVLWACSVLCQSTTAARHGWPEGCPALPGHSTAVQPGEHQPGHEEPLAHASPLCQGRAGVSLPRSSRRQHWGHQGRWEQPAPICHSQMLSTQSHFLLHPATGLCHHGGKKQKAFGLSGADDAASDTVPSWRWRCRGGGTRQAACEGQSPSPFHWGPQ